MGLDVVAPAEHPLGVADGLESRAGAPDDPDDPVDEVGGGPLAAGEGVDAVAGQTVPGGHFVGKWQAPERDVGHGPAVRLLAQQDGAESEDERGGRLDARVGTGTLDGACFPADPGRRRADG